MAILYKIFKKCESCGGDGKKTTYTNDSQTQEIECDVCKGKGKILWGTINEKNDNPDTEE